MSMSMSNSLIDKIYDLVKPTTAKNFKEDSYIHLYQYEIKGYPKGSNLTLKGYFNKLTYPDQDECGLVKWKDTISNMDKLNSTKSSCDVIQSEESLTTSISDLDNSSVEEIVYYQNKPKNEFEKNIYDDIYVKTIVNSLEKTLDSYYKYVLKYLPNHVKENIIKEDDGLIYNIKLERKKKVIVFGDFHGSYHTFFRHILRFIRLGIIKKDYVLDSDYMMIFLGDVLDRGNYALDILHILFKLCSINNTPNELNVIYNRGNHEFPSIYQMYGFEKEVKSKLSNTENSDMLLDLFNQLLRYMPSAIILTLYNGKRIWMSHGGIPVNYQNLDEPIKITNNSIAYYHKDKLSIPTQIRWNDFHHLNNSILSGETGRKCSVKDGYYCAFIGTKQLEDFIGVNKLDFIIRGHQDRYHNSYLLSENSNEKRPFIFPLGRIFDDFIEDNPYVIINKEYHNKELRNAVKNEIVKLLVDGNKKNIIYDGTQITLFPVLTISTNTDYGRSLRNDSYVIIE